LAYILSPDRDGNRRRAGKHTRVYVLLRMP
jgi:hypothetical protein